jgi:hypothetical protein
MEERLKLNSKFLLTLAAAVPAALMPLAVAGQVAPERPVAPRSTTPSYKYEATDSMAARPPSRASSASTSA